MAQEDLLNDLPGRFIIDPDRLYTEWGIWEVYTGPEGPGSYVPNVDDSVRDWDRGLFRVATVDYTTGLSNLVPWDAFRQSQDVTTSDVLLGVGPGFQSETWRVYLDTRKIPHTLEVDGRLHLYGTQAEYIKIFKGTDVSVNGTVISAFYDQSGNFLGENIPLELVRSEDPNNLAIKAPMTGYTGLQLPDGEVVTVVAYSNSGSVVTKAKMLIDNTSLVRRTDAGLKYVTGIRIESPFLSDADPTLIEFPININVASATMQGIVEYSDGSVARLPITEATSDKFSLFGLRSYVPTILGQTIPLTLNYKLSANEYSYVQGPTFNGSITERYRAKTIMADNSYTLKLFAFPVWRDEIIGYDLDFWLYNLDRQEYYRLPKNVVELTAESGSFNGTEFVRIQRLTFAVNMNAVDPKYTTYRHVQTMDIALKAPGNVTDRTNWTIGFNPGDGTVFGEGLSAPVTFIDTNSWTVNLGNAFASRELWLRNLFWATHPLYDTQTETEAPSPTHFVLVTARRRYEFSIDQWNDDLSIYYDLNEGEVFYLEWIKRTFNNDLQLGVTGLIAHQVA